MGCNTSQESVPKAEENDKNAEEKKEMTKGDNKPESAKTITLTSNGTALSGGDNATTDHKQSKEHRDPEAESEEDELEKAAAKIQAAFRGHQTRKSMKQPSKHEEAEPTREELERDFRPEDTELCHAATKIQASFRGHMTRKEMDKNKDDGGVSPNKSKAEDAEELDIDLSDPDLNKAAVKIQASFRGHMARKDEHESEQK